MAWQPPGSKGDQGQMCYFTPGEDATKLWDRHPISEPSKPGKEIPFTRQFSHGLGCGDVNGDGRLDIICPAGWWEQPEKIDGTPWKFHPANLGPDCANMYAYDVDGDGKEDIISSSAHHYGLWWHKQKGDKESPTFERKEFFQLPAALAKVPSELSLNKEEQEIFAAVNKARAAKSRAPWRPNAVLSDGAKKIAVNAAKMGKPIMLEQGEWAPGFKGTVVRASNGVYGARDLAIPDEEDLNPTTPPWLEVGIGFAKGVAGKEFYCILVGDAGAFSLPAQTHALNFVDINGDGLKDLVTGRRWWAHGPKGDADPGDSAVLYWFEAKKNKDGSTEFIPHLIDDDSGMGTQFQVIDINGDGLPDVIVSNKKGVFVFIQVRTKE
ncbi:MAG: VCBS repeat-containing protein [Planctomycetes bacterium]|nr:VCBS repeat-containing protein [Planctomycetota bacterium]